MVRIVTSRHRASYSTSHNVPNGNRLIVVVLGRDEVQKHSLCDVSTLLDNDIK